MGAIRMRGAAAMVVAAGCVVGVSPAVAQDGAGARSGAASLPVRDIVLYRSGVGYFERRGMVEPGSGVELTFDREQVSDILKSLVVLTGGGVSVGGVTYDSEEPLARKLASYGIDVSDGPAIEEILDRLRGEEVVVEVAGGTKRGVILGVQESMRVVERGDSVGQVRTVQLNLLSGVSMQSVPMDEVVRIELVDEALARDLADALAAIAADRTGGLATVRVGFDEGEGTGRGVRVGYVHEMPVWKTTYRLVLPELSGADEREVLLQGWAIVENTTDTDWEGVRLSLAAGQPSSFRMDLYSPVFRSRPMLPVPLGAAFVAKAYEAVAGVTLESRRFSERSPASPPADSRAAGRGGGSPFEADGTADLAFDASNFGQAAATGETRGAQFFYTVDGAVDVPRKQSAMLPMLVAEVPGERVSIYNPMDSGAHPLFGVRFENDSGLHLLPGPITVIDGEAYAGDAQVGHTSRGEEQLLAYAVDVDVNARVDRESSARVQTVRIVDGLLIQEMRTERSSAYVFSNDDSTRGRTVIVEHPKSSGFELVSPGSGGVEETASAYRLRLDVPAGGSAEVAVVEERVSSGSMALADFSLDELLVYERTGRVSSEVANAVRRAGTIRGQREALERERARLQSERGRLERDQARARENLASFDQGSEGRQRFVAKLLEAETEIERIDTRLEQLQREISERDTELRNFLRNLNLR